MGRKVTQDEVDEWVAMHAKGYTYKDIAQKYGRHPKTVGEHMRERMGRGVEGGERSPVLDKLVEAHFSLLASLYAMPWIVSFGDKRGGAEWQNWMDGSARHLLERIAEASPQAISRFIEENPFIEQHRLCRVLNFKLEKERLEPHEVRQREAWVELLKKHHPLKLAEIMSKA